MGFRFGRSIKIAPGIRVNFGKRGASVSVGPRGAIMTFSSRGTHANVSIPGTGLSYRTRIDSAGPPSRPRIDNAGAQARIARQDARYEREVARQQEQERRARALAQVSLRLQDDGTFTATNTFGEPLSAADMRLLWDQQSEMVTSWLQARADDINGDEELLSGIHLDTQAPDSEPIYTADPFEEPEPPQPAVPDIAPKPVREILPELGLFERHSKTRVAERAQETEALEADYQRRYRNWLDAEQEKAAAYRNRVAVWERNFGRWRQAEARHQERERELEQDFPRLLRTDTDLMATLLDAALDGLDWPRETLISYQIDDAGRTVWLDVDLPEIEDLPQRVASIAADGRRLIIKAKAKTQLLKEYAVHIHGIALRIAGAVFATLPAAELAVISGYSQRMNRATGQIDDEYLFSIRFDRGSFSRINFAALECVDPVEAVTPFEHRRSMTKTGVFKSIQPFYLALV